MGVPEARSPLREQAEGEDLREGVLQITGLSGRLAQAVLQETRLRLLAVLSADAAVQRGGYTLQELAGLLSCSPQNVHHHLRILADVGAVRLAASAAPGRVPRQHWVSDVRTVRLVADTGEGAGELALEFQDAMARA